MTKEQQTWAFAVALILLCIICPPIFFALIALAVSAGMWALLFSIVVTPDSKDTDAKDKDSKD